MSILVKEFIKRTHASLVNEQINEYDGKQVEENKEWISKELILQVRDLHSRF